MRFSLALLAAASLAFAAEVNVDFKHGDLKVSPTGRYLIHADRTPFFYLGDTAWELFHRLNREDAETYLENRRNKGFTVIQAVVLAELDGLGDPNPYGHVPLVDRDPAKPNEDYFQHVDWIVRKAAEKGLVIGMLPTWGNKVVKASWEKTADVIFNPENARVYGKWIGSRYRNAPNLIWILGGDRDPANVAPVWRAMAAGIREGDGGRHLITYHPQGGMSSSKSLHKEPWLDFNMLQSSHSRRDVRNDEMVARDYALTPVKPAMDGEPPYENHPVNWKPQENGWFDEYDVRQGAYWALLAGAHGHTYGCHDIWQFVTPDRKPVGLARGDWRTSMDLPGAGQMVIVRKLMESRPMLSRAPDQSLIVSDTSGRVRAARGDGYAFVYLPDAQPVTLRLPALGWPRIVAWWYDPRTGESASAASFIVEGDRTFDPPGKKGRGNDWVLVLDDRTRGFAAPGVKK